jgi:predicted 3-demethylubiquinone-9 3-methyltransferase (glyoxalase superfamily)
MCSFVASWRKHSKTEKTEMVTDAKIGAGENGEVGRIAPCLWFDDNAEDAAKFYVSLFNDAAIERTSYYSESVAAKSGGKAGSVLVVRFRLPGMNLLAMNAGPTFKLTPALSLIINCDTQEQIDFYWDQLCDGGTPMECGWVTDKFGLTWQVNWSKFDQRLTEDSDCTERMMMALMEMKKVDIAVLERACRGE